EAILVDRAELCPRCLDHKEVAVLDRGIAAAAEHVIGAGAVFSGQVDQASNQVANLGGKVRHLRSPLLRGSGRGRRERPRACSIPPIPDREEAFSLPRGGPGGRRACPLPRIPEAVPAVRGGLPELPSAWL